MTYTINQVPNLLEQLTPLPSFPSFGQPLCGRVGGNKKGSNQGKSKGTGGIGKEKKRRGKDEYTEKAMAKTSPQILVWCLK